LLGAVLLEASSPDDDGVRPRALGMVDRYCILAGRSIGVRVARESA